MISVASFVPLVGGFAGLALATLGVSMPRRGPTMLAYVILAVATALWGFSQFTLTGFSAAVHPLASGKSMETFVTGVVMMVALSAAMVYWVLFALAFSGRERWIRGWRFVGAHIPIAAVALLCATNPEAHLLVGAAFADRPGEWATCTYGFIAAAVLCLLAGSALISRRLWYTTDSADRRGAAVIALLTIVLAGLGVLFAIGGVSGREFDYASLPSVFAVLVAMPAFPLMRGASADLMPAATSEAFDAMTDAVLVLDSHLRLAAMNLAALSLFPDLEKGRDISTVCVEIARHAKFCLDYACDDLAFETRIGGSVFWGRARRSLNRSGVVEGVVVLLSDLTRLREMQTALLEQGMDADGGSPAHGYLERLRETR